MKLLRYDDDGTPRLGVLDGDRVIPLAGIAGAYPAMLAIIAGMRKSFDTHGPVGPWIVTADEVPDPHALKLRGPVHGQIRQDSDTGESVCDIRQRIACLSDAFTLEPGDLLATGTPPGAGAGMQPPRFLQPGDVVRGVEGIGAIDRVRG